MKAELDLTVDDEPAPAPTPKRDDARRAYERIRDNNARVRESNGKDPKTPLERKHHEARMLAQHSSKSWEHYTPHYIIELARETMGGIDLDPASCPLAQTAVQATHTVSLPNDGLAVEWHGRVMLNPPGGDTAKVRPQVQHISRSYPAVWWAKLMAEHLSGRCPEAVFICFKLDLLQVTQNLPVPGIIGSGAAISVPSSRLPYNYPSATIEGYPKPDAELVASKAPPCPSAIVYLGPNVGRFLKLFAELGSVVG